MSRADILQAVRAAQFAEVPLPDLRPLHAASEAASIEGFTGLLDLIGARWERGASVADAAAWLQTHAPAEALIASLVPGIPGTVKFEEINDPHQLDGIDTAVIQARFGVCENGAVWLTEIDLGPHRVLPFIAEHLFIVLNTADLVATMHQAYDRIGALDSGFGLFLAGPSKTADIEQCLVIGAHGARSCTLFLVG